MKRTGFKSKRRKPSRSSFDQRLPAMATLKAERQAIDGHACVATGLHHADCPRWMDNHNAYQFIPHHVQPREENGRDEIGNLITVWNGPTGKGLGGCHARIHNEREQSKALGLLKDAAVKWAPIGDG